MFTRAHLEHDVLNNSEYFPTKFSHEEMSHGHSHGGGCNDECHDHDVPESEGPRDNLYLRIDKDNTVTLNVAGGTKGGAVIKPWHERMSEEVVSIRVSHGEYMTTLNF